MRRISTHVQTSIKDETALGGFGSSNNSAVNIQNSSTTEIILNISTKNIQTLQEHDFYTLSIQNHTDSAFSLLAQDSRINCRAQIFWNNSWQFIEYNPNSWCGNSYHIVTLASKEKWEIPVPKYCGKKEVQLRYCLDNGEGRQYYSNEIIAFVNLQQINKKEGHSPRGLMDPYNE